MSRAKLTRNQLAAFLPTPEAIKAFEQILSDVGITLPNELEAVSYTAENALAEAHSATEAVANLKQDTEVNSAVTGAQVNQLLDSLNSIAQSLALLATAPPREEQVTNPFDNVGADLLPPNVKQNADLGFFPMQWPTKNPRGNGSWADLWVPQQYTFVDNVLSLRNQSRDAGGTIYGLAAICMLDGAGAERGAVGYSRNSAIQPAGYTPDIVYVEFGDPFTGDANPSSFQLICTMAGSSAWFPGTTFVPMEHLTKTGETIMRTRGGMPLTVLGDVAVGEKTGVKELRGWMTNTAWRLRERDNIDSAAWTTNMSDAGVQDDAAKSSWKVKIGYGNTDDSFKIERAPAGSASFTELLKVAANGNVQLNTQAGNTLIGRTATSTFGSNGILQLRENTNEFILSLKNAASKEWVWGVNGTTTYFRNITDSVTPVIYDNAGNTGFGITPAEKVTVDSNTSEYAVSWAKVGSKKWVLGSYAGGSYLTNATDGRKHIQNLDTGETLILGGGLEGMRIDTSQNAVFKGTITHADTNLMRTSVALGNGAAAAAGTLANAPVAGNPTKWIPINDNGTTRYIPAW